MEPPRQTAEMASVPRLERCSPGPTSLSRTPSGALVTVECGETPPRGGACRRLCAGVLAAPGCSQRGVGRDALSGPAPHLHMVSCRPLPNSLSADATMLATQALVQRLLMDSDHQRELRPGPHKTSVARAGQAVSLARVVKGLTKTVSTWDTNRQRPGIRRLAAETQVIH